MEEVIKEKIRALNAWPKFQRNFSIRPLEIPERKQYLSLNHRIFQKQINHH